MVPESIKKAREKRRVQLRGVDSRIDDLVETIELIYTRIQALSAEVLELNGRVRDWEREHGDLPTHPYAPDNTHTLYMRVKSGIK